MLQVILIWIVALCLSCHADEIDYQALSESIHGTGIYTTSDHSRAQNRLNSFARDFQSGDKRVLAERAD